jgi:hypothetical protein
MSPQVGRVYAPWRRQHRFTSRPPVLRESLGGLRARAGILSQLVQARSGNAAAEFALILPAFIALFAGIIQYGSMFVTYNAMVLSARDAAREVAVGKNGHSAASSKAKGKRPKWVEEGNYSIETTDSGASDVQSVVTVPGDEATVLPLLPMPENLSVTVVMAKES